MVYDLSVLRRFFGIKKIGLFSLSPNNQVEIRLNETPLNLDLRRNYETVDFDIKFLAMAHIQSAHLHYQRIYFFI